MGIDAVQAELLLRWYQSHRRDLPWRRTTDPYRILVSEVMLQQTQVRRVIRPYERFLARFPTVDALAAASLADVLAVWSGLGYNQRAIRLREAARMIVSDGWPTEPRSLQLLPGVGPYTAAAVACFAFGRQVATPDTNVRRVLSRWAGFPLRGRGLVAAAEALLPEGPTRAWNQALMDLGAMICRPAAPHCGACPAVGWCGGPGVYEAPRAQVAFEGSSRQARGRAIRALVDEGTATARELSDRTGLDRTRLAEALAGLVRDGLVVREDSGYALAR